MFAVVQVNVEFQPEVILAGLAESVQVGDEPDARFAEQLAVVPPPIPAQVQVHGPVPATAEAVPALHKCVGVLLKVSPLSVPQTPFT